jgi:aminoglycoside/choline kinase family phosphotransferase
MKIYLGTRLPTYHKITKLPGEASTRSFFRLSTDHSTVVAMVYPRENKAEIQRIIKLTDLYKKWDIPVPVIIDVIDDRIVLQEDLGDHLVQSVLKSARGETYKQLLRQIRSLILKLAEMPLKATPMRLDNARMKWEMDFFLTHFVKNLMPQWMQEINLKGSLYQLVDAIQRKRVFAHRDFHSRNMLFHKNKVHLVDFQDSLQAPRHYDLVSFLYDSYTDLQGERERFLNHFREAGMTIDQEQLYLTALQRNIKALGTFANQITVHKNLSYKKYIARTIRHVQSNPLHSTFIPDSLFAEIGV